jgi:hypothetical protein
MADGIYIVADLFGHEADRIDALTRELDPKYANLFRPHVTLTGSSGAGVLPSGVSAAELIAALTDVAGDIAPLDFVFGAPERFPATNIIMLPLPVHGQVRWLHDRIARCGLPFAAPRFAFTPHCTVHFFRTMTDAAWQRAQRFRVRGPIRVARIQAYETREPQRAKLLCDIALRGLASPEVVGG